MIQGNYDRALEPASFAGSDRLVQLNVSDESAFQDIIRTYICPLLGVSRSYDLDSQPCIAKTYNIAENITMGSDDGSDSQLLVIGNLLSNRTRVGAVFSFVEGKWKYLADLKLSGNLTDFSSARSVAGMLQITSDTISTTNTNLSGRMTSINVTRYPQTPTGTPTYADLPAYATNTSQKVVNVPLSTGTVITTIPYDHKYEDKTSRIQPGSQDFLRYEFAGTSGPMPPMIQLSPTIPWYSRHGMCYITVVTGSVDPVTITISDPDSVLIGRVEARPGVKTLLTPSVDVYNHEWSTMMADGLTDGAEYAIYVEPCDPIYGCDQVSYRFVTYIQGSIGVKNITLAGAVGIEALPRPEVIPQITLEPSMPFNPLPRDYLKRGLDLHEIPIVYTKPEYRLMVAKYSDVDVDTVVAHAAHVMGNASIGSFFKKLWRKVIKPVGTAVLKGGVPAVLNAVGLASDVTTASGGPIRGYAASMPSSPMTLNNTRAPSFDDDVIATSNDAEQAEQDAAPLFQQPPDDVDWVSILEGSFKRQSQFNYLASNSDYFVRFAPFMCVYTQGDGQNTRYIGSELAVLAVSRVRFPGRNDYQQIKKPPDWMEPFNKVSYVFLDSYLQKNVESSPDSMRALILTFMNPRIMANLQYTEARNSDGAQLMKPLFLTVFHARPGVDIAGNSWLGALFSVFYSKDPSIVYEMAAQVVTFGGIWAPLYYGSSDLDKKWAGLKQETMGVQGLNNLTANHAAAQGDLGRAYLRALLNLGLVPTLGSFNITVDQLFALKQANMQVVVNGRTETIKPRPMAAEAIAGGYCRTRGPKGEWYIPDYDLIVCCDSIWTMFQIRTDAWQKWFTARNYAEKFVRTPDGLLITRGAAITGQGNMTEEQRQAVKDKAPAIAEALAELPTLLDSLAARGILRLTDAERDRVVTGAARMREADLAVPNVKRWATLGSNTAWGSKGFQMGETGKDVWAFNVAKRVLGHHTKPPPNPSDPTRLAQRVADSGSLNMGDFARMLMSDVPTLQQAVQAPPPAE